MTDADAETALRAVIVACAKETGRSRGIVEMLGEETSRILLEDSDRRQTELLVRTSRLRAINAAFPSAEVELITYCIGAIAASILDYVGPSREELLNRPLPGLTNEEIKILDPSS